MLLSLSLLICDHNWSGFSAVRPLLSVVAVPIQYSVNWPVEFVKAIGTGFTSRKTLLKENEQLRAAQLILQEQVQRLNFLEQENAQLRTLLSSARQLHVKTLAAQILSVAPGGFSQQATINKGKHDGLYIGQPVLDAYGVLGQVVMVGMVTSKVLLLTDSKSAIPAILVRSGAQVIAQGVGRADTLEVSNIPETGDVQIGDFLVSSDLGQRFPEGHPIGTVSAIKHVSGERFMKVIVTPSAHVDRSRHVLLVWVEQPAADQELMQDDVVKKSANKRHKKQ